MKVQFLLFEQFQRKENIGSSRIRGHWLVKHWAEVAGEPTEAAIYRMGALSDVMVYQKVYWIEHAEKYPGIKILDMCDPDFLHWGYRFKQMVDCCDAVTTSTQALADIVKKYTDKPVVFIPDRLELDQFADLKKEHKGEAKVAGWYGYSENFPMLDSAISSIIKNGYTELVVIANSKMPYQLPAAARDKILLTNVAWGPDTVLRDLLSCDVIVNPQSSTGKWKYKSNNKTVNAWALGLPVAHSEAELRQFKSEAARIEEGNKRYDEVRRDYDIKLSVKELKQLIQAIYGQRKMEQPEA